MTKAILKRMSDIADKAIEDWPDYTALVITGGIGTGKNLLASTIAKKLKLPEVTYRGELFNPELEKPCVALLDEPRTLTRYYHALDNARSLDLIIPYGPHKVIDPIDHRFIIIMPEIPRKVLPNFTINMDTA